MISSGPSVLRLANFVNGNPFKPSDLGDEGLRVIRIRQLLDRRAPAERALPPARPVIIDRGDLIFSWSATLAVRHWYGDKALLNQHLFRVDPLPGIEQRWLGYVLTTGIEHLQPLMHGSAMTHITRDMLRMLRVSVPTLSQQRAIADYLDTETDRIDTLITKKGRMIELLEERKKLQGEEVIANLRKFENCVPLKRLVGESDTRYGAGPEPTLLSVSIHHGVVPRDTVTDRPSRTDNYSNYKVCQPGDIAINRMRAFQGGVGVVPHAGVVSPDYTVLRMGRQVSAHYLHFVMRSSWFVSEMTRRLRGIGATDQGQVRTPRINYADLGLIQIPVPAISRQRQISHNLAEQEDRMAQVTKLLAKQVEAISERRQALIKSAVTGELAVPAD